MKEKNDEKIEIDAKLRIALLIIAEKT